MTNKEINAAISRLWTKFHVNPFVLISIARLQSMREQDKGWLYEDELPDDYDYDANFDRSEIMDGVRMFPDNSCNG